MRAVNGDLGEVHGDFEGWLALEKGGVFPSELDDEVQDRLETRASRFQDADVSEVCSCLEIELGHGKQERFGYLAEESADATAVVGLVGDFHQQGIPTDLSTPGQTGVTLPAFKRQSPSNRPFRIPVPIDHGVDDAVTEDLGHVTILRRPLPVCGVGDEGVEGGAHVHRPALACLEPIRVDLLRQATADQPDRALALLEPTVLAVLFGKFPRRFQQADLCLREDHVVPSVFLGKLEAVEPGGIEAVRGGEQVVSDPDDFGHGDSSGYHRGTRLTTFEAHTYRHARPSRGLDQRIGSSTDVDT